MDQLASQFGDEKENNSVANLDTRLLQNAVTELKSLMTELEEFCTKFRRSATKSAISKRKIPRFLWEKPHVRSLHGRSQRVRQQMAEATNVLNLELGL